ncbi:MAG: RNA polymerase sigma factor, partial [Actinomycetales bacterium]
AGTPPNPVGWLLTVARTGLRDLYRSAARRTSVPLTDGGGGGFDAGGGEFDGSGMAGSGEFDDGGMAGGGEFDDGGAGAALPARSGAAEEPGMIPDRRLALMFVCAHPAIAPAVRTPLMLQTVLGLTAARIAAAYLLPESAVAQRLVRAKRRILAAGIPFTVPGVAAMPSRLTAVLEAIYGAYSIDWPAVAGPSPRDTLAEEARYLAGTVAELLPDEPEASGLAALISLSMARAGARAVAGRGYVPLEDQDTRLWDAGLIRAGEAMLLRAHASGRPGRFQLEAAIQSVHCARAATGATDWAALVALYSALVRLAPTLGARVSLAAAIGRAEGPAAGLAVLDRLAGEPAVSAAVGRFQPAWATRAALLAAAGRTEEAAAAYGKAAALSTEPAVRRYLLDRRSGLP